MQDTRNTHHAQTMNTMLIGGTFVFLVSVSALLLYSLYAVTSAQLVPGATASDAKSLSMMVDLGIMGSLRVSSDSQLLLLVMLSGALGGTVHGIRSAYWYIGNREIKARWLPMYVVLPLSGAMLAVGSYLLIRGGLMTPTPVNATAGVPSPQPNVYGFGAMGFLVGMFSQHAAVKLKQLMDSLFGDVTTGADHVTANPDVPDPNRK